MSTTLSATRRRILLPTVASAASTSKSPTANTGSPIARATTPPSPALLRPKNPITTLLQLGLPSATGIFYGASVKGKSGKEPPNSDTGPAGQNPQLKGPLTRYAVSLTIRAQDVSFGQAPNGARIAKLLVGVKAYGKDGAALNWQASREGTELSPTEYASIVKTGIPVTIDIDLPSNTPAQLVTAVYDLNTDRSGTLETSLHP